MAKFVFLPLPLPVKFFPLEKGSLVLFFTVKHYFLKIK